MRRGDATEIFVSAIVSIEHSARHADHKFLDVVDLHVPADGLVSDNPRRTRNRAKRHNMVNKYGRGDRPSIASPCLILKDNIYLWLSVVQGIYYSLPNTMSHSITIKKKYNKNDRSKEV